MFGYLRVDTAGASRSERVAVRHEGADNYSALYAGRWRKVYIQVNRLYIVYWGEKITIEIEGV